MIHRSYRKVDLKRTGLLSHSHLYSMEAAGLSTGMVESLTGYISRLAEAHGISTGRLVGWEIVPRLGKTYMLNVTTGYGGSVLDGHIRSLLKALNGTGTAALEWGMVLEKLTLRRGMRFLTMMTWREVISERHLFRHERHWCPACYEEWRRADKPVYEPLIWALNVVHICTRHELKLQSYCPYCLRARLPILASRSRPGRCSSCGQWLGIPAQEALSKREPIPTQDLEWHRFIGVCLDELLTAAPCLPTPPLRRRISESMNVCVENLAHGSVCEFARLLRMPAGTVNNWHKGLNVPQLDRLLLICGITGVSALKFLTGKVRVSDLEQAQCVLRNRTSKTVAPARELSVVEVSTVMPAILKERPPPSLNCLGLRLGWSRKRLKRSFPAESRIVMKRHANYRKVCWAAVERKMRRALTEHPPPSVIAVAARLGYSKAILYSRVRELCHAIAARHTEYERGRIEDARNELCKEVRQAVLRLHSQGIAPTYDAVSKLLAKPGSISYENARATLRETKGELGLKTQSASTSEGSNEQRSFRHGGKGLQADNSQAASANAA